MWIVWIPVAWVHALSDDQKWRILENYKDKQYELLFESNLWDFSNEFNDIFNLSKKVDIYDNVAEKHEEERQKIEQKNFEVINQIHSLEASIKEIDDDIQLTMLKVDKINKNVINVKKEIEVNQATIDILRKKINENTEILLEYLVYLYKKSNTAYEEQQIDNLKSILLNQEDISDVINDLYFKGIIQMTWKKLIDDHRKYVADLYMKKIELEKQEKNLKKLRKMQIIEKKMLDDKKDFKERILEVSKWQQSVYEEYVQEKLEIERRLQINALKEKVKFNNMRDDILEKYWCEFIDVTKNTAETRSISKKCYDVNLLISHEAKLDGIKDTWEYIFDWPIEPDRGISAYYHEKEYEELFWMVHDAVDIPAPQWTPIKAPADWYIVYIQEPVDESYAFVAIKHHNGYMTIYGHVNEVLLEQFDYVKKGEIFAQSGWEYGTLWAWYYTTWPHLHFEVYRDEEHMDPMLALDLSYIQYAKLPEKYHFKFYADFKKRRWYEYKNKSENTRLFKLEWDTEIERQQYLIKTYAVWSFNNWEMWVDEALDANIDPSFLMCIWLAETTLWKYLKTAYNIWNVWNTDSWATKVFNNAQEWLYAMTQTLNNRYLSQYDSVNQLSRYWNKDLTKPIYASSEDNWHKNIIKCLSHLKWNYVPDNYQFRILSE